MIDPTDRLIPPFEITQDDVLAMIGELAQRMPHQITLKEILIDFIRQIAQLSARIDPRDVSDLISVAAVVSKYAAAEDYGIIPIGLAKETKQ